MFWYGESQNNLTTATTFSWFVILVRTPETRKRVTKLFKEVNHYRQSVVWGHSILMTNQIHRLLVKQCNVRTEVCMYQNNPKSIEHPFQKMLLLFDVGGIKGHVLVSYKLNYFLSNLSHGDKTLSRRTWFPILFKIHILCTKSQILRLLQKDTRCYGIVNLLFKVPNVMLIILSCGRKRTVVR